MQVSAYWIIYKLKTNIKCSCVLCIYVYAKRNLQHMHVMPNQYNFALRIFYIPSILRCNKYNKVSMGCINTVEPFSLMTVVIF